MELFRRDPVRDIERIRIRKLGTLEVRSISW
jgi:hypothetical protein